MALKKKRVVITGIGPIASTGIGKFKLWEGLINNELGVELIKRKFNNDLWDEFFIHKVKDFDIDNFKINNQVLAFIRNWKENEENKDLLLSFAAIKLALDDSKLSNLKHLDAALVVTHENPSLEQFMGKIMQQSLNYFKKYKTINGLNFANFLFDQVVKLGYETQSFMYLFHIAKMFNIHKYSHYINNACASGLYGIELANDMIQLGKVNTVIVVASDSPDIFKHLWFKKINMYPKDGITKPFSINANGFLMGEGACALILEDLDSARKRNAHIYAEYIAGAYGLEGWNIITPRIGYNFLGTLIKNVLSQSSSRVKDIDLICAHGTGTIANDFYEAKSLMNCGFSNIPVCAFKPYVGHNLGGSALIELAILLLCMQKNYFLPCLNITEFYPGIKINLLRGVFNKKVNSILKICSAFAGYNAAAIFRRV